MGEAAIIIIVFWVAGSTAFIGGVVAWGVGMHQLLLPSGRGQVDGRNYGFRERRIMYLIFQDCRNFFIMSPFDLIKMSP